MKSSKQSLLAKVPQVSQILEHPQIRPYLERFSRELVLSCVKQQTQRLKEALLDGAATSRKSKPEHLAWIVARSVEAIEARLRSSLRRVINATGIILHTGLGRAPLPEEARQNLQEITAGYCNLEIDLASGKRGDRLAHVEALLCHLTGAEAACVVNNNAAAVFLTLNTLSFGREAIISRGQLIEIGGSFRMPDVMAKSGARMVEVGTTNRTHLKDYERAITENTAVILAVHSSNYRIQGFTHEVPLSELVALGKRHGVTVIHDLGGGVLLDLRGFGLPYEPVVRESIEAGADVVMFSGDKVLGGPQAGIIVGNKSQLEAIRSNPLMRAVRCDKLTLACLESTLKLFLEEKTLLERHRVLKLLLTPSETLEARARHIVDQLSAEARSATTVGVEDAVVQIGSGAMPLEDIPSKAIVVSPARESAENLAARLRAGDPPVIGYIRENRLFLDVRTVGDDEDAVLLAALQRALVGGA